MRRKLGVVQEAPTKESEASQAVLKFHWTTTSGKNRNKKKASKSPVLPGHIDVVAAEVCRARKDNLVQRQLLRTAPMGKIHSAWQTDSREPVEQTGKQTGQANKQATFKWHLVALGSQAIARSMSTNMEKPSTRRNSP